MGNPARSIRVRAAIKGQAPRRTNSPVDQWSTSRGSSNDNDTVIPRGSKHARPAPGECDADHQEQARDAVEDAIRARARAKVLERARRIQGTDHVMPLPHLAKHDVVEEAPGPVRTGWQTRSESRRTWCGRSRRRRQGGWQEASRQARACTGPVSSRNCVQNLIASTSTKFRLCKRAAPEFPVNPGAAGTHRARRHGGSGRYQSPGTKAGIASLS